ncbi:hypothetical protein ACFY0Z_29315 [Streptomyces kronopolitis]|uniref:hypothetical protein n=1 Tax=Streptomyces kronopolitis TaxID=1612435 RepID=UPI00368B10A8
MSEEKDTSIKVSRATRERLRILARENKTTISGLVEEMAQQRQTQADLRARGAQARGYLREHMGVEVGPEDEAAGQRLLEAITARAARGAAA